VQRLSNRSFVAASLSAIISAALPARAQVVAIDPFAGEWSEGFEDFTPGAYADLPVFSSNTLAGTSFGSMASATVTSASTFMGSTVTAHEGLLFAHSAGPIDIVFSSPIQQFGAYIATNGGADGGMAQFFDADNELIASVPLDVTFAQGSAPHTWNGWNSGIPFARVNISSNGVLGGFIGIDDMQVNVPGPMSAAPLIIAAIFGPSRRRSSHQF
jgi:hypothetical protein